MEDKTNDYSDIFVTEDNTFDVTVKYYKENNGLIVEGVDDSFNNDKKPKQFVVTMKYPAQSDVAMIYKQGATFKSSSADDIDVRNILELEFSRFLCLMRKWTLAEDRKSVV